MLKLAILAMVAAISAVGAAEAISAMDRAAMAGPPPKATVAVAEDSPEEAASISKAPDGHYWAEADVDGQSVHFLVDTGATAVALTATDAQRLGIDTHSLDYAYQVATANGQARAARVTLASISVAGARVDDVQAYVLDRGLETSLLGMTYLGRLSAFEATPTSLILRP